MQSEATTTPAPAPGEGVARRRLLFALPATAFAGLAGLFAMSLARDPSRVPSPLIGTPAPEFSLPPVQERTSGLSKADLFGTVSLVKVFASWCVECRAEHPLLMQLASDKTVPIYGLNYKDKPGDAARWLNTMGDPYARAGADLDGRAGIDWGVYGVPETFVVGADGVIAYKHIGAITDEALADTILPIVVRLRQLASGRGS